MSNNRASYNPGDEVEVMKFGRQWPGRIFGLDHPNGTYAVYYNGAEPVPDVPFSIISGLNGQREYVPYQSIRLKQPASRAQPAASTSFPMEISETQQPVAADPFNFRRQPPNPVAAAADPFNFRQQNPNPAAADPFNFRTQNRNAVAAARRRQTGEDPFNFRQQNPNPVAAARSPPVRRPAARIEADDEMLVITPEGQRSVSSPDTPRLQEIKNTLKFYDIINQEDTTVHDFFDANADYNPIMIFLDGRFHGFGLDWPSSEKISYVECKDDTPTEWQGNDRRGPDNYLKSRKGNKTFVKMLINGVPSLILKPRWYDNRDELQGTRFYKAAPISRVNKYMDSKLVSSDWNLRDSFNAVGAQHCNQTEDSPAYELTEMTVDELNQNMPHGVKIQKKNKTKRSRKNKKTKRFRKKHYNKKNKHSKSKRK